MANARREKGVSLAKGPVALVGLGLLVFGVLAFILGGHSFATNPVDGTVQGENFLGFEFNAWSSLLTIAAGLLLVFGAPLHWGAKTMSLVVGLALGAASVIALYDRDDVFGIFAANGPTKLLWGAAGTALLVLSLLPRVGGKKIDDDRPARRERVPDPEPEPAVREREPVSEHRTVEREHVVEQPVVERRPVVEREADPVVETGPRSSRRLTGDADRDTRPVAPSSDDLPGDRVDDSGSVSSRDGSRRQ